jgi:hydroxyacylglutathione hydrolase
MRFSEDIYVYEWTDMYDNNCNSFYIAGNVHALIDPGLARYVPDLLQSMKIDGLKEDDIRYIINTHSHPDHFDGSKYFNGKDVRIALHDEEIAFLNGAGGELYSLFGLRRPDVQVNLPLKTGEIILGDVPFQIIHIPGHSPGSVGLYYPKAKALFCGDVIFDQNVGRTDFPGGSGALLKKSIVAMSKMDVECLLPGHMGVVDGAENVRNNFSVVIQNIFPYL